MKQKLIILGVVAILGILVGIGFAKAFLKAL